VVKVVAGQTPGVPGQMSTFAPATGSLVCWLMTVTRRVLAAGAAYVCTVEVQLFVPAVAVTVMSPVATEEAASRPAELMVAPLVASQVVPPKCSGLPSASRRTTFIRRLEPARTSPGLGVTSQEATWLAAGAVLHAPLRQDWPTPHCASLPQAGARQTASSQTALGTPELAQSAFELQVLTQTELRQTCLPPLPVQSASVVQADCPASFGVTLPLLQAKSARAASAGENRRCRWVTQVPLVCGQTKVRGSAAACAKVELGSIRKLST